MPKGIPNAGYRKPGQSTLAKLGLTGALTSPVRVAPPKITETWEQIEEKLAERFDVLHYLTKAALTGDARSLIISGPAGLGKSFAVEEELAKFDPEGKNSTIVKGYVRATGLFKLLHAYKEKNQVIVFDDADSVFYDDTSLNFLKAVCDTTDRRHLSYLTEGKLIDDDSGLEIPKKFEFKGTIIFITNLDFDKLIAQGHKLAPHLQALLSRSHYIDLMMKTKQDYIVRIHQVAKQGLLKNKGLDKAQEKEVLDFIVANRDRMRELSLRMALKLATIRRTGGDKWEKLAKVTCLKNV